jgi:hypothetical protein
MGESLSLSGAPVLGLSGPAVIRHSFRRADLNEHAGLAGCSYIGTAPYNTE